MDVAQADKQYNFQTEFLKIRSECVRKYADWLKRIVAEGIHFDIVVVSEFEATSAKRYLDDIGVGASNPHVTVAFWHEAELNRHSRLRFPFNLLR